MTSLSRSVLIVVLLLTVCGSSQASVFHGQGHGQDRPEVRAVRVLDRWEGRRAAAYAAGDVRGLRRLYSRASRAGARDAAILRAYGERGLVVEELATQVRSVQLLDRSGRCLRLRVVERFAGGTVSAGRSDRVLPAGTATTRVITLVRADRGWVVRGVRPARG
jgi:hypothetical protein